MPAAATDLTDLASRAACFVIVGETHPEVKKHEGEAYRLSLQSRAADVPTDELNGTHVFRPKDLAARQISLFQEDS